MRPRESARWLGAALLLAALLLFAAHAARFLSYVNDDAYITFRYSRFLATGRGPYFNPGEHVEGYSNLLWMLLMAPVYALGGEGAVPPFAKGLGLLCGSGCMVTAFLLCRRLAAPDEDGGASREVAGALAAGLLAASPAFVVNAASGLETALFSLLLTLGALLSVLASEGGRWRGAGIVLAAAALTRPEGPALAGACLLGQAAVSLAGGTRGGRVARRLRLPILDGLVVALATAAQYLFRWLAYDGEWLPNTYYAKAGGVGTTTSWAYVRDGALPPLLGALGVAAAAAGWAFGTVRFRAAAPLLALAAAGALLPFATGPDWMLGWRLVVPILPAAACAVALGWSGVASRWLARPRWLAPLLLVALVPLAAWTQSDVRAAFERIVTVRARGYREGHRALAEWLRGGAAKPGDTVALMDIGIVGYLADGLRILDITGLTDRHIAKSPGAFLLKQYDPAYLFAKRPEFVVLTFAANGDPDRPPEGLRLLPWSPEENAIFRSPEFRARYLRSPAPPRPGETWLEDLARSLGAERVFQHAYPDRFYLLAVFRRQPGE